jgi:hypothetical protein
MGKFIVGLIIGIVLGVLGAMTVGGGAMMGIGVATGLSTGICATVQAAREEGFMSQQEVDRVLTRAAQDLGGKTELPPGQEIVDSAAKCDEFLAKLEAMKQ